MWQHSIGEGERVLLNYKCEMYKKKKKKLKTYTERFW